MFYYYSLEETKYSVAKFIIRNWSKCALFHKYKKTSPKVEITILNSVNVCFAFNQSTYLSAVTGTVAPTKNLFPLWKNLIRFAFCVRQEESGLNTFPIFKSPIPLSIISSDSDSKLLQLVDDTLRLGHTLFLDIILQVRSQSAKHSPGGGCCAAAFTNSCQENAVMSLQWRTGRLVSVEFKGIWGRKRCAMLSEAVFLFEVNCLLKSAVY